jgi:phosphoglycolate phosphatase-like HAD superfamily hydrolase
MADRHTLIRALEKSGMRPDAAEEVGTEIYDAIHDNVATKSDLQRTETALRTDFREVEQRLELRFATLERQIDRMVIRLGALVVVGLGLLFTALHQWPPAHG